jgi:gelsolin
MFTSDDVYIFNSGPEIFVWVGKGSSPQEKKSGLQYAMQYVIANNLPPTTPISRILEGGENPAFNSLLDV